MKTQYHYSLIRRAVACLICLLYLNVFAGPAPALNLLSQAYTALASADHDYKGHRVAAMKQIEAAASALGENIRGDGKGHEKQGISDEQLRLAQGLLEQARTGLNKKPLRHVDKALKQLSIALSIK